MLCICRKNLHCILKKYGWDDANFDIELKTTLFRGNNLNILIFDFSYIFSSSKVQSPQRVCFWFYTHQVHLCAFFRHWINLAKLSTENTNYMDFSKLIHGFWKLLNRYVKIVTCVSRLLAICNVWPRFLNQQSLQCKRGYKSWGGVAWFLEYVILLQQSTLAKKDPLLPVIIFEMAMQVAQN